MKTDQLIHVLVQDLSIPTVGVGTALKKSLPIAAAAIVVGFPAIAGMRPDVLSTGLHATMIKLALGIMLAIVGMALAIKLSQPEQGGQPQRWLFLLPIAAVLIALADLWAQGTLNWQARLLGKNIWICLLMIPVLAAVPMATALLALRNGATAHLRTAGALAGIGSAGIAMLGYGLFCTEDSALFIAAWYVAASAIAGVVGAALASRMLRW